jgi:hypothetical protein
MSEGKFSAGRVQENIFRAMSFALSAVCILFLQEIVKSTTHNFAMEVALYCFALAIPPLVAAGFAMCWLVDTDVERLPFVSLAISVLLFVCGATLVTIGLASFLLAHDDVLAKVFIVTGFASCGFFFWFYVSLGNANKAKLPTG